MASLLEKVATLISANLHALVDQALSSNSMAVIDQYIRQVENHLEDLEDAAREVLGRSGYEKYIMHDVSHYVGMSVHDVGNLVPFEPGVVIAVEPGVYIPDKNLGIRIEDTVLVTEEGCEILTRDVPKEIEEIEKLMFFS